MVYSCVFALVFMSQPWCLQVLAVVLIQFGRQQGVRCSGVLCLYWFLHLITASVILYSKIVRHVWQVCTSL